MPTSGNGRHPRFIIAGGGTGGHLFPGVAVAREILERRPGAEVIFVVSRRKMEMEIVRRQGFQARAIDIEGIKGRGRLKQLAVLWGLPRSLLQARGILREVRPAAVIGMGGYSAGPVCLVGHYMGIPTAIHEQNFFPGLTNRWLARYVDLIFISFEESRIHFKDRPVKITGNPVRDEILAHRGKSPAATGPLNVLVVGGSQGAKAVNDVFIKALPILQRRGVALQVTHQTGRDDYERIKQAYSEQGLAGQAVDFIDDMAGAYARAHLVVGRAGATTIFELAALGKPSILVPYPFAANNHQELNALSLADKDAAIMLRQAGLTPETLADVLADCAADSRRLEEMGKRAMRLGRPQAAAAIVEGILQLADGPEGGLH